MLKIRTMKAASALVLAFSGTSALAAPVATLLGSSATITQAISASNTTQRLVTLTSIPEYNVLNPAIPLQLPNGQLTLGSVMSTAKGGIGLINTGSFLGIALAPTSSITQRGNTNPNDFTASVLTFNFQASWQLTQNLGPNTAGISVAVAGALPQNPPPGPNIPSPTAFIQVGASTSFGISSPLGAQNFRPTIDSFNFVSTNIQGPYSLSGSDVTATNPATFSAGSIITISGSFQFRVHNDVQEATAEVQPGTGAGGPYDPDFALPTPSAAGMLVMGGVLAARRRRA